MNSPCLALVAVFTTTLLLPPNIQGAEKSNDTSKLLGEKSEGLPVTIPRAKQYDFVSHVNGRTYRLLVHEPADVAAGKPVPVAYILDGDRFFATAASASSSGFLGAKNPLIVGIDFPTNENNRRFFELTPTDRPPEGSGGGDSFIRVILEEIRPFIESRYKIEKGRRAILGSSLGGLIVLRILFRNPSTFDAYVASSPSIWWNDRSILNDEESFSKRAKTGELRLRLLITSAGDEQYRGNNPERLARDSQSRMIDNAAELAARLKALNPEKVAVVRMIIPDESHGSGAIPSMLRGLRFAAAAPAGL